MSDSLLLVSPLPPAWSGIATYTAHLLPHLQQRWEVTVLVADDEHVDPDDFPGVEVLHTSSWSWRRGLSRFDRALFCLGNSPAHVHVPSLIERHGGVVLAHDVRLNALQAFRAMRTADRHWLSRVVAAEHGRELAAEIEALEATADPIERLQAVRRRLDRANTYLLGSAVREADIVVVHSEFAARLARLDIGSVPVEVVPFGHPAPVLRSPVPVGSAVLSSFGFVAPEKGAEMLVDAMVCLRRDHGMDAQLRFVGHCDDAYRDVLRDRAGVTESDGRMVFVGRVDDAAYSMELGSATVSVQLRTHANGEASAAIADCLAHGVPTIVTDIGGQAELPGDAVVKLGARSTAVDLAVAVARLLADDEARCRLGEAAQRAATARSFAHAADGLDRVLRSAPALRA